MFRVVIPGHKNPLQKSRNVAYFIVLSQEVILNEVYTGKKVLKTMEFQLWLVFLTIFPVGLLPYTRHFMK